MVNSLGPLHCPCDWTGDGRLDSQDSLECLSDFFARPGEADFNLDGTTDSQDFFEFLACLFTGCD